MAEDNVTELHGGLKGTMNALQLQEIGRKTPRRGLQGVVRAGRHTGGRVCGYRIRRELDASGDPVRGPRDIDDGEANVVREIFRRYAAGTSPPWRSPPAGLEQHPTGASSGRLGARPAQWSI